MYVYSTVYSTRCVLKKGSECLHLDAPRKTRVTQPMCAMLVTLSFVSISNVKNMLHQKSLILC